MKAVLIISSGVGWKSNSGQIEQDAPSVNKAPPCPVQIEPRSTSKHWVLHKTNPLFQPEHENRSASSCQLAPQKKRNTSFLPSTTCLPISTPPLHFGLSAEFLSYNFGGVSLLSPDLHSPPWKEGNYQFMDPESMNGLGGWLWFWPGLETSTFTVTSRFRSRAESRLSWRIKWLGHRSIYII